MDLSFELSFESFCLDEKLVMISNLECFGNVDIHNRAERVHRCWSQCRTLRLELLDFFDNLFNPVIFQSQEL